MDPEKLAKKYHGRMASTYDSTREGERQWESEQRIVEDLLAGFPRGTSVLDVPVGTGRFLAACVRSGFNITGVDSSSSMLSNAREKVDPGAAVRLEEGRIYSLPFPDGSFDVVVCIRFMDWVAGDDFRRALAELARVTRNAIIVYIPTFTPAAELNLLTLSGFERWLKQWKLRFYMARTRSESVIHRRSEVLALIERLGLTVERRLCIDGPSDPEWWMGEERDIYLLRKRG